MARMRDFLSDCRFALHLYGRAPATSAIAIAGLGVAIAFTSALLSLYIGLVVRPHPGFQNSDRIVSIAQTDGTQFSDISYRLIERIDEEVTALTAMTGHMSTALGLDPDGRVHNVELVTRGFFSVISPRLVLGRGFDEGDHNANAEPVAVISHDYWQRQFDRSEDVIGSRIRITGASQAEGGSGGLATATAISTTEFRIIGVMSDTLPSLQGQDNALWLAYEKAAPLYLGNAGLARISQQFRGLARLADGASLEAATADLNRRYAEADNVDLSAGFRLDSIEGLVQNIGAQREAERQLALSLAVSVLLAVVAAANISLFLLSRWAARLREFAIRMSVGATLQRLERQLVTEAGLLVVFAAVPGILGGFWLSRLLQTFALLREASWQSIALLDWRVLAALLLVVVALVLLVSQASIRGLRSIGIAAGSRHAMSRPNLTQRVAIGLQISIAGAVGAAAIALGTHLGLLLLADRGYNVDDIRVVTIGSGPEGLQDNGIAALEAVLVERERQRETLLSIPGVAAVAFGSAAPGVNRGGLNVPVPDPRNPGESVPISVVSADRQYFEMFGLPLVEGSIYDVESIEVMLANETAAELLWGTTAAINETVAISVSGAPSTRNTGVAADVSYGHPQADALARAYIPLFPLRGLDFIFVRTPMSAAGLRSALEPLVESGRLEIRLGEVRSLETLTDALIEQDRTRGLLTIAAAVLIVLLTTLGYYGTQQLLLRASLREFAIRASLGAGPASLGRRVLLRGFELGLPGVAIGSLLAFVAVAWLRGEYVADSISPALIAAATLVALVVLLVSASIGPTRRARQMQPAPLLREEL